MIEKLLKLGSRPKAAADWIAARDKAAAELVDAERRLGAERARRSELLLSADDATLDAHDRELRQAERAVARLEAAKADAERRAAEAAAVEEQARLDALQDEGKASYETDGRGLDRISALFSQLRDEFAAQRAGKALRRRINAELVAAGRERIRDPEAVAAAGRAWTSVTDLRLVDPIGREQIWPPSPFNPMAKVLEDQRAADVEAATVAASTSAVG